MSPLRLFSGLIVVAAVVTCVSACTGQTRYLGPATNLSGDAVSRAALISKLRSTAVNRAWISAPPNMPNVPDADVDKHIDGSIVGDERTIIELAFLSVPPWQRQNMIVDDGAGHVYVSQPRLRSLDPVTQEASSFRATDGSRSPDAIALPAYSTTTGAFRSVYSDTAAQDGFAGGYTGMLASLYVPCDSALSNLQNTSAWVINDGDVGFMYIEGFDSSNNNFEVGVQYSAYGTPNLAPYYRGYDWDPSLGSRFPCNYTTVLSYETLSTGAQAYLMDYNATSLSAPDTLNYTGLFSPQNYTSGAWYTGDPAARAARTTSIAQKHENFTDGAYFGLKSGDPVNNPGVLNVPLLQWQSVDLYTCQIVSSTTSVSREGDSVKGPPIVAPPTPTLGPPTGYSPPPATPTPVPTPQPTPYASCVAHDWNSLPAGYQNYPSASGSQSDPPDAAPYGNQDVVVRNIAGGAGPIMSGTEANGIVLPSAPPLPGGGIFGKKQAKP